MKKELLELRQVSGQVDGLDNLDLVGWAIYEKSNKVVSLDLYINGLYYKTIGADKYREDLAQHFQSGYASFSYPIPIYQYISEDVKSEFLEVSVYLSGSKIHLKGSPLRVPLPNVKYSLEKFDGETAIGWAIDFSHQDKPLYIDVIKDGESIDTIKAAIPRIDLVALNVDRFDAGFSIYLRKYCSHIRTSTFDLKIHNTNVKLNSKPLVVMPFQAKTHALLQLQQLLNAELQREKNLDLAWLRQNVIPELIEKARSSHATNLPAPSGFIEKPNVEEKVDIIVPVYRGLEETINCIQSVIKNTKLGSYELIVLNDSSPEPEMQIALEKLSEEFPFTLLLNENNLGFVGTVNKGMKLNANRDVVLLNSDTVVPKDWLKKLNNTAYSERTIGTVTPFSNNATICSYPKFCQDNELPKGYSLDQLNEIFENEAVGSEPIDLPTCHGFCVYIKRETLAQVGYFDEQKWGKGYAEENDFSMRAANLGWRNVLTKDTFIHHLGSVSFAEDSEAFIAKNLAKLNGIYPDYPGFVEAFIKDDPVRNYRNKIAMQMLKDEQKHTLSKDKRNLGSVLFVSLTIGGGTEIATNDISKILRQEGKSVFMLTSLSENMWELKSLTNNTVVQYKLPSEKKDLINDLKFLLVEEVNYHHTLQFSKEVWDIPKSLDVPYEVTLHDYMTICPRVNLIDETQTYCGEPSKAACNRCINRNGVHESSLLSFKDLGGTIESWRDYHFEKLKAARKVITPSKDSRDRVLKYFNLQNIEARYHPEPEFDYKPLPLKSVDILNVAFIGAVGVHKGLNILKECAQYAYKFDLPIKFTVIGYTADDIYFDTLPNVTITGKYKNDDLPKLIKKNNCHVAGLFSVWPETYSYTLSEAIRAGLHIAAFDYGAIKERTKAYDIALSAPENYSAKSITKKLLAIKDIYV